MKGAYIYRNGAFQDLCLCSVKTYFQNAWVDLEHNSVDFRSYFRVNSNNEEQIQRIPLYDIIRSNNGGFYVLIEPITINLTKCYIELVDTTGLTTGEVVCFNFIYTKTN